MSGGGTTVSVANSRDERGKAIARLAGANHGGLLRELEAWLVSLDELVERSRDLTAERAEARTMVALIGSELRSRQGQALPITQVASEAIA
jgi:hypothetical protein